MTPGTIPVLAVQPETAGTAAAEVAAGTRVQRAAAWRLGQAWWALHDVWVLTRRTLARVASTPEQVINVTVLPVVLVLLFSYVFKGALRLPGHASYTDYVIVGVFAVNMGATAQGAAIGLAIDLSTGLIDRFRSLPMARGTVLIGRTVADLALTLIAGMVTAGTGLLVGWRVHAPPWHLLLAAGLALLFAWAAAWLGACIGILARGADSAQAVGLMVILPLSLTSSAFISVDRMTPWLRDIVVWNPVSVLAVACRGLLGDPAPAVRAWPIQHAALASAAWSAVLLALLIPAAVWLYQRRGQR